MFLTGQPTGVSTLQRFEESRHQPNVVSPQPFKAIENLQKMEQMKNRLGESLMQTQHILDKIDGMKSVTMNDLDNLKGCINNWVNIRDESYAEEKHKKEAEENARRGREKAEKERKKEEAEQRKQEKYRKKGEEDKRRQEEEKEKKKRD